VVRPVAARLLALAALSVASFVVAEGPGAGRAGATCNGGSPVSSNFGFGIERARYASTCDGDGWYAGFVADTLTDGSCVWVVYRDAGWDSQQGRSCSSGGANYSFTDRSGDSYAQWTACRNHGCGLFGPTLGY
jgi:hypothetical protein